jgi:hypothetical protein
MNEKLLPLEDILAILKPKLPISDKKMTSEDSKKIFNPQIYRVVELGYKSTKKEKNDVVGVSSGGYYHSSGQCPCETHEDCNYCDCMLWG